MLTDEGCLSHQAPNQEHVCRVWEAAFAQIICIVMLDGPVCGLQGWRDDQ